MSRLARHLLCSCPCSDLQTGLGPHFTHFTVEFPESHGVPICNAFHNLRVISKLFDAFIIVIFRLLLRTCLFLYVYSANEPCRKMRSSQIQLSALLLVAGSWSTTGEARSVRRHSSDHTELILYVSPRRVELSSLEGSTVHVQCTVHGGLKRYDTPFILFAVSWRSLRIRGRMLSSLLSQQKSFKRLWMGGLALASLPQSRPNLLKQFSQNW